MPRNVEFLTIPEKDRCDNLYCFDCMLAHGRRQEAEYRVYGMNTNNNVVLLCGKCANENVVGLVFEGKTVVFEGAELQAPLTMRHITEWQEKGKDREKL